MGPLMGLKSLERLDLKDLPAVPAEQIEALRQALPDADIITGDYPTPIPDGGGVRQGSPQAQPGGTTASGRH